MMRVTSCLLRQNVGCTFCLTLSVGIFFGFSFACFLLATVQSSFGETSLFPFVYVFSQYFHHHKDLDSILIPDLGSFVIHGNDTDDEAGRLARKVRILCWVMTSPKNHVIRARHVKATWGRRCNILLFMSSSNDTSLPTIKLCVPEGRWNLWAKTKESVRYVYKHFLNDADWFLKIDDDTYVIVENLRYMLSAHKPTEAIYFGFRFKPLVRQGYMSGGAGYVLSREAIRRFIEEGLPNMKKCSPFPGGSEDVQMGRCLEAVGVRAGDSRDSHGRGRFFPLQPAYHLIPDRIRRIAWYWRYTFYDYQQGLDCCSDYAITFHYIKPSNMYMLEYVIYHLRPYGISHNVKQQLLSEEIKTGNMLHETLKPTMTDDTH